ncbi:MAG: VCBS repeat-containing protein [Planctomycetota bacterium]
MFRSLRRAAVTLAALACLTAPALGSDHFQKPTRLRAGEDFVDTEIGHAAPYIADWDGDGKLDLLVGQFGDGKLRIYKNTGTNKAPEYAAYRYFQIGGKDVKVPTG